MSYCIDYFIIHYENTQLGKKTRLAITLPKVNQFGWNLEHCDHTVEGAIRAVATIWEAAKFFLVR